MKLRFKKQAYQTRAVEAVADCFKGQPNTAGISYRVDPGSGRQQRFDDSGFKNAEINNTLPLLENIQAVPESTGDDPGTSDFGILHFCKKRLII